MRIRFFFWISFAMYFILLYFAGRTAGHKMKWKKSFCRQNMLHKRCRELAINRDLQKLEPLLEQPRYSRQTYQDYKRGYRNSDRPWQENVNIREFI